MLNANSVSLPSSVKLMSAEPSPLPLGSINSKTLVSNSGQKSKLESEIGNNSENVCSSDDDEGKKVKVDDSK